MLLHEREDLNRAVSIIRKSGKRRLTDDELAAIEDAVGRIRETIERVLYAETYTIFQWGFCLYLADSGYVDDDFSKIDRTGKAWERHVQEITGKCRAFLPRLEGLGPDMKAKARRQLAEALEEAGLAVLNVHCMADD